MKNSIKASAAPTLLKITNLRPFEGHPYKVQDDAETGDLMESIKENGILTPLVVRPIADTEEYEVISGHRRLYAAQKAGLTELPVLIRALDRDSAAIAVVDSNLHREHIRPSEKAFAYKLKMEALSHRGITCGQVGHKSRDAISDTDSGRQVQRYIRLTYLIPALLKRWIGMKLLYLLVWSCPISTNLSNEKCWSSALSMTALRPTRRRGGCTRPTGRDC